MKILVSDYDNTYELHYNNFDVETIFNNNKIAVQKYIDNGNIFVLATGRHFDAIKKTIDEKKIKFNYLISNNGAELYDSDYKLLYVLPISLKSLSVLRKLESTIKLFYRQPYKNELITSVNIYFDNNEAYKRVKNYLDCNLSDCFIEYKYPKIKIINKKCNKINGIKFIQKLQKVNSKKIYTIGDDVNDLKMIKHYNGFSLLNSNSIVKKESMKLYKNLSNMIYDIMENDINRS